jgi:subtilisin-like proprotein convertase family protein
MGSTAWYNWTAPSSSPVNIDTFGSDFDTVLAIYTGNSVGALTLLACNDDYIGPSRPSLIRFTPSAGTTYRIQVGGYLGAAGNIIVNHSINATLLVGTAADNLNADGALSLREALMVSNGSFMCSGLVGAEIAAAPGCSGSGSNLIHFLPSPLPPSTTIVISSALPNILSGEIISGLGTGITIDGVNNSLNCFTILGGQDRIHGLTIRRCARGIQLLTNDPNNLIGVAVLAAQGNTLVQNGAGVHIEGTGQTEVYGNYIGTTAGGNVGFGNSNGIELTDTVFQIVGNGLNPNVISGNTNAGVWIGGGASFNTVSGNLIGTNPAGTAALGNATGVLIQQTSPTVLGNQSSFNTIVGNTISGNTGDGVRIEGKFTGQNTIKSNRIGVNPDGTAALPNGNDGVELRFTSNNAIGGSGIGEGNVISGNVANGVNIASNNQALSSSDVPKAIPDLSTITSNLSVSGGFPIVDLTVTLNITHTYDSDLAIYLIPPTGPAIELSTNNGGSADNYTNTTFDDEALTPVTGGSAPFNGVYRPETALSQLDGLNPAGTWRLQVADQAGADVGTLNSWSLHFRDGNNAISGNFIGTSQDGYSAIPNDQGVRIFYSQANLIGGVGQYQRNVISGNTGNGINVEDDNATDNQVFGNYIGTNRDGNSPLPNLYGVRVGGSRNKIGLSGSNAYNVISGNSIGILFSGAGSTQNVVQNNYIGVRSDGATALPNTLPGICLCGDIGGQTIGGTDPSAHNYIMRNSQEGIYVASPNNLILANDIRYNGENGVYIESFGNQVGSASALYPNYISDNGGDGVQVNGVSSTGNRIRANSIYSNAGLGINNINGGNTELAPPAVTTAGYGTVGGTACANCSVDVFRDDTNEGEGFVYLGTVNADGAGNWTFAGTIDGPRVTATATNAGNNTSEFSSTFACGDPDGDLRPTCNDNCPYWSNAAQNLPPWPLPAGDADCDGFPDTHPTSLKAAETTIGTDPVRHCSYTPTVGDETGIPAGWPADFNDNQLVNGSDWVSFNPRFGARSDGTPGQGGFPYNIRWDLNANGLINGADMLQLNPFMFNRCA